MAHSHADRDASFARGRLHETVEHLPLLRRSKVPIVAAETDAAQNRQAMTKGGLDAESLFRTIACGEIEGALTESGVDVDSGAPLFRRLRRDRKQKRSILDGAILRRDTRHNGRAQH